jgi:hypothetical protein
MGKKNVQNLFSFYLNTEMYRKFAIKELGKKALGSDSELQEVRIVLSDFAKGLIHLYLLNAINFTATDGENDDEEPVNIVNRVFYKKELAQVIERMENSTDVDETLLDELQFKIYLLMKQKYYPDFKNYPEFHKILLKNDLIFKLGLSANSITMSSDASNEFYADSGRSQEETSATLSGSIVSDLASPDGDATSMNGIIDALSGLDTIYENSVPNSDNISQLSFDLCTLDSNKTLTNDFSSLTANLPLSPKTVQLSALILSSGNCFFF